MNIAESVSDKVPPSAGCTDARDFEDRTLFALTCCSSLPGSRYSHAML